MRFLAGLIVGMAAVSSGVILGVLNSRICKPNSVFKILMLSQLALPIELSTPLTFLWKNTMYVPLMQCQMHHWPLSVCMGRTIRLAQHRHSTLLPQLQVGFPSIRTQFSACQVF
jgi:hypothetical protein